MGAGEAYFANQLSQIRNVLLDLDDLGMIFLRLEIRHPGLAVAPGLCERTSHDLPPFFGSIVKHYVYLLLSSIRFDYLLLR
jgi:hypothetical protein